MPMPISETLKDQDKAASDKAAMAKRSLPQYLVSSMLAGAFVGVAVVLLLMVSAPMLAAKSATTKLVQGSVFGIALTLVVFAGAELFTGNVMVMLQGLVSGAVDVVDVLLVWLASLIGNLVGALGFSALVGASGVINAGGTKKVPTVFTTALAGILKSKVALTGSQLFFRSILCNMLVCLALWMASRTKSDAAKILCLWWALLAFVASGFEHSIANMTAFGLGIYTHVPGVTASQLLRNLSWTVPGNIVGGGILVGLAYGWIGRANKTPATPTDGPDGKVPSYTADDDIYEPGAPEPALAKSSSSLRSGGVGRARTTS